MKLPHFTRFQSSVTKELLVVAFGYVLGKLISVSKEVVVAAQFGVGVKLDSFVLAFTLCMIVANLLSGGISGALLPQLQNGGLNLNYRKALAEKVLVLLLAISLVAALILYVAAPSLIATLYGDMISRGDVVAQVRLMVWLIPLGATLQWAGTILAWRRNFMLHAFADAFPALGILGFAMAGMLASPDALALGALCGSLVGVVFMLYRSAKHVYGPALSTHDDFGMHRVMRRLWVNVLGMATFALIPLIEQLFAARIGVGTVSTLSYAQRVMVIVLGMGSLAVGRVAIVHFGEAIHARNHDRFRHLYSRFLWLCFGAGGMVVAVGVIFSNELVRFIFERGAFDSHNTVDVANALKAYLLMTPFCLHLSLLAAIAQSFGRQKQMAWAGLLAILIYLGLCTFFSQYAAAWPMALAMSIMYIFYWWVVRHLAIPATWTDAGPEDKKSREIQDE